MPMVLRGACIKLGAVYVRWMSHATARCATAASAAPAASPQWLVCGFLWAHVHFFSLAYYCGHCCCCAAGYYCCGSARSNVVVVDILISFYLFNVDSNWLLHNLCSEIDTTAAKGISHVDTGCCLGSFAALKSINKRRKLLLHNISLS